MFRMLERVLILLEFFWFRVSLVGREVGGFFSVIVMFFCFSFLCWR